ncbi:MAG: hypothetical protein ABIH20_06910 [Candidatus Diapherotrites archaeon]
MRVRRDIRERESRLIAARAAAAKRKERRTAEELAKAAEIYENYLSDKGGKQRAKVVEKAIALLKKHDLLK